MSQLVKTTITLPNDLLHMAKLMAAKEKTTVSELIKITLAKRVRFRRGLKKNTVSPRFLHLANKTLADFRKGKGNTFATAKGAVRYLDTLIK